MGQEGSRARSQEIRREIRQGKEHHQENNDAGPAEALQHDINARRHLSLFRILAAAGTEHRRDALPVRDDLLPAHVERKAAEGYQLQEDNHPAWKTEEL